MILSNTEIFKALKDKRLVLTPEPAPRYPAKGGERPYATSSVDLRLSDEVAWFSGSHAPHGNQLGGTARLSHKK